MSSQEMTEAEGDNEELDPRVQEELEKLNNCTDEINRSVSQAISNSEIFLFCRLEIQLDDANTVFRQLLSDSTHHLKSLSKKLGNCIEKARPYYESVDQMTRAQAECQKAAVQFQRAAGIHAAAKETISLAEERFLDNSGEWQFDNAWQEMLNHATIKVMDAEKLRAQSEKDHLSKSAAFTDIEQKVKVLEKKLSRHIDKSKPYFEQKEIFNKALNSEKSRVGSLQTKIAQTKCQYAQGLRNLEEISESIHARRKLTQSRLECPHTGLDMDSLTYDLDTVHLAGAGGLDTVSLASSDREGRDSALGSASNCHGSVSTVSTLDTEVGDAERLTKVERSHSLPDFPGGKPGGDTADVDV